MRDDEVSIINSEINVPIDLCFDSVESIDLTPDGIKGFSVLENGLRFDCVLDYKPSDTLFVCFHGAVDRDKHSVPRFARWNWSPIFGGSVLAIADPTLHLMRKLRIAWYLGDEERFAWPILAELVERVATLCDVRPERVVFYASSGGAYASLGVAMLMPVGRVVAVNTQSDILKYLEGHKRDLSVVFKVPTLDIAAAAFPDRFSVTESLGRALDRNQDLRIILVQNVQDVVHLDRHYAEIVSRLGGIRDGGIDPSGRLMTILYDHISGHGREPAPVTRKLIPLIRSFLLDADAQT